MKKFETVLVVLTLIFTALYSVLLQYTLDQPVNIISFTTILLASLMYAAWMISVIIVALLEDSKDTLL